MIEAILSTNFLPLIQKKLAENLQTFIFAMVEPRRIELLTSCMPCKRSPS